MSEPPGPVAWVRERIWERLGPTGIGLVAALVLLSFLAGWALGSGETDDEPAKVATSSTESTGSTELPTKPSASVPKAAALPSGTVPKAPIGKFACPAATIEVTNANQLTSALENAEPGAVIHLADGVYEGEFKTTARGTAAAPIHLCGGRAAILQGEGFKGGYVLHFDNAAYWQVNGFTVRSGQKGVMVDTGTRIALQGLLVADIGDEAVHLRNNSTDNVVRGLTIRNTGNRRDKFGEGVYVGTAVSNWPTITNGQPDKSDRNFVLDNVISETTAESIDIKEGTSNGVVAGNTFDGSRLSGADSWVDVKGNGWLIAGNRGRTSPEDGFQTHVVAEGWGDANFFTGNMADLDGGSGVGYYLHELGTNKVSCNNKATGASGGLSNHPCNG